MARCNPEQLNKLLKQSLSRVYLIAGDEPLLVQECCIAIRRAAKQADFIERELFHTDSGFQWPQLLESANSLSLFAQRKLIEVRLHNLKIGTIGSKTLQSYCAAPTDDNLLMLIAPKLDRGAQNSAWYKAIDAIGTIVTVWPISEKQLPRWLDQRMQKAGLRADSRALEILASKIEGNLLAAVQEIEKLKLLTSDGVIDGELMASAVVDSARYNVFGLVDKALSGNARGAATTLNGLKTEGTEATLILWALTREVRTLITLKHAQQQGQALEQAARRQGVFDSRLALIRGALQRLSPRLLQALLKECAQADRAIKGMALSDPWNLLLDIVLVLSGTRTLAGRTLSALLE